MVSLKMNQFIFSVEWYRTDGQLWIVLEIVSAALSAFRVKNSYRKDIVKILNVQHRDFCLLMILNGGIFLQ